MIRADASWKPDERQKRVQRPRRTTGSAGREETGEDSARRTIEYGGIIEAGREEGEDRHEGNGAANEGQPADSNDRDAFQGTLLVREAKALVRPH
jgi:hypothetical protein